MFESSKWMYSSGGGFYGHEIDGSLRFNDNDSAYLTRSPASAGNRKIFTISVWVKRGNISASSFYPYIFDGGTSYEHKLSFVNDYIAFGAWAGSQEFNLETNAVYRDPSAWYHIVVAQDTTQATASDRVKMYVNGEQVTSFKTSVYPSQNYEGRINNTNEHAIGRWQGGTSRYFDGYMAEFNFIDGQALSPTSFGQTKSGVWIPKAYSGSYGTNGFHLEFNGNANDSAGSNNWTANNISSYDYVADSPTNNFAVLNPEGTNDISSFSQGNLQITTGSGASSSGATMGMSSGKWYAEFVCTAKSSVNFGIGITKATTFDGDNQLDEGTNVGYFWVNNATINHGFANDSYGSTWGVGDVMGVAFDADTLALQFYINGVGQGNYTRVASEHTAGDHWIFGCGEGQGGATATIRANFGQDSTFQGYTASGGNSDANGYGDFKYSVPSGYLALCTANLTVAEGVDPALDASPQDYFTPLLYTGDGSSPRSVTGVGFAPDFVWIKKRNVNDENVLQNRAVGATKGMISNSTGSEFTITEGLKSFDSDGFTLGNNTNWNGSGGSFVSWNWKAGGAGSANSEGSVTTTSTSANTDAGFSIITWTGDGTLGHGLDQAPEMFIVKIRNTSSSWWVWHKDLDNTSAGYMQLNDSGNAERSNTSVWRNAYPATATTIDVNTGYLNYSTDNYLALCFHSVEGLSSFGKYVGNGGGGGTSGYDGPFVYTGFKPSFVLVRNIDNGWNWVIWDSKRDPYNQVNGVLQPNNNSTEYDVGGYMSVDFLSNGFKIRSNDAQENGNGQTHIYMAFAENPFKYSTAR